MRVLVTGGAGFIGSAACRAFVRGAGWRVLNVDKLTYAGNPASVAELEGDANYAFLKADIADAEAMARAFAEFQPDAVLHLAAETHVDRSIESAAPFLLTNVIGTQTLLEAARRYWSGLDAGSQARFRFLHVSTDEVFGSLDEGGFFCETTAYSPRSPYSASKAASDHLARAWRETYGLPVMVANCSNNYGPRQFPEKLIPLVILSALEGKPVPVYGDGLYVRDWLYVEDHVAALSAILKRGAPAETYVIGGRSERTNLSVVHNICDILDALAPDLSRASRRTLIEHVTDRPGHDRRYAVDCAKIERELGWRATRTFEEGLRATVQWYLDNGDWWRPIRDGSYRGERLGLIDAH